ncbi:hypothetical protein [Photobacterium leiognathi]|uniref:hypothetical protein n=1 Tax=Photobacterium leiognathi TaxID=553611 RepID=UPI002981048A|nr:hypothetical protein [Photobacterium leiognathi]
MHWVEYNLTSNNILLFIESWNKFSSDVWELDVDLLGLDENQFLIYFQNFLLNWPLIIEEKLTWILNESIIDFEKKLTI